MLKPLMFIVGILSVTASIILLKDGIYPTSGLMFLSFGIVTLLVASVLKFKKNAANS